MLSRWHSEVIPFAVFNIPYEPTEEEKKIAKEKIRQLEKEKHQTSMFCTDVPMEVPTDLPF